MKKIIFYTLFALLSAVQLINAQPAPERAWKWHKDIGAFFDRITDASFKSKVYPIEFDDTKNTRIANEITDCIEMGHDSIVYVMELNLYIHRDRSVINNKDSYEYMKPLNFIMKYLDKYENTFRVKFTGIRFRKGLPNQTETYKCELTLRRTNLKLDDFEVEYEKSFPPKYNHQDALLPERFYVFGNNGSFKNYQRRVIDYRGKNTIFR